MRLASLAFVLIATLGSTAGACADTITTFNLTDGTFTNGATATGTVTIDTTTGLYTAEDLSIVSGKHTYTFDGPVTPGEQSLVYHTADWAFNLFNAKNDFLDFSVPASTGLTLVGYTGGQICSYSNLGYCDGFAGGYSLPDGNGPNWESGNLVAVAATPEPSSLLLLSTGIVALLGLAMRKRSKALPGVEY